MSELKLHMFLEDSSPEFVGGMLKMFYHAANVGRIGMAEKGGQLYLVGIENEEGEEEEEGCLYELPTSWFTNVV